MKMAPRQLLLLHLLLHLTRRLRKKRISRERERKREIERERIDVEYVVSCAHLQHTKFSTLVEYVVSCAHTHTHTDTWPTITQLLM